MGWRGRLGLRGELEVVNFFFTMNPNLNNFFFGGRGARVSEFFFFFFFFWGGGGGVWLK